METVKERFEAKVTKSDGCWEWSACKGPTGYGQFRTEGRVQRAHRVAYQLYVGEIPDNLQVLHHCDNPHCVRPDHLFLGTIADNMRDRDNKGRGVMPDSSGEKSGNSKLTEEDVQTIRTMHANGTLGIDLAREFRVSQAIISMVVHYRRWTKVP